MNKLKRKLNNQTGASITYALLIFLVCAVIGSAVLVAGTATSGRMSKVVENDQRYYAVTSAARLILNEIENKPIIIIEDPSGSPRFTFEDENGTPILNNTLLYETADLVAKSISNGTTSSGSMTLSTSSGVNTLAVTINENMSRSTSVSGNTEKYTYTLELYNTNGTEKYKMTIVFVSNTEKQTPDEDTSIVYRKIEWNPKNIQVVGSQRWQE